MNKNQFFADYFYKCKIISQRLYDEILEKLSNQQFDCLEFLIENNHISHTAKMYALSAYYNVPYIDMDMARSSFKLNELFSLELLKKYCFIPLQIINDTLIVAASNPNVPQIKATLGVHFSQKVEYVLADEQKILDYINSYQSMMTSKDALSSIIESSEVKTKNEDEVFVQNAPSVKFVNSIIREALSARASDIHIEPTAENVVIRYRIDGDLIKWNEFPISTYPEVSARIKILSGIDIAEKRIPQDGRILMNINDEEINFRVSSLPTIYGEKFVIRVLDNKIFSYNLDQLNFSKHSYKLINKIIKHPHGIILLTGPTGSGKTTTLYAILRELNDGKNNIVTIEDPVEYAMDGINQVQVNKKADLTFASSLRSILRQDPDIIMIGEIRDEETAQIATRAAITGHLVLSTLHTNDAPGAIVRLIDMGIPQYLVQDSVVAVMSQRLVKKLCPHCKRKVTTSKLATRALGLKKQTKIFQPKGCEYCNHTGYKGRLAVHEIMYLDQDLRDKLNNKNLDLNNVREIAIKSGMVSLAEACKEYVLEGITSLDEYMNIILGNE